MSNPYAPPPPGGSGAPGGRDVPGGRDAPGAEDERRGPAREPAPPPAGTRPEPRPPADREAVRAATRQVLNFGLLLLAALVTAGLPLPFQAGALALSLAAVVVGVRALRAVIRDRVVGLLGPALGVGLGLSALMVVSLGTVMALWPLQMERQECLAGALTISARQGCETAFEEAVSARLTPRIPQD